MRIEDRSNDLSPSRNICFSSKVREGTVIGHFCLDRPNSMEEPLLGCLKSISITRAGVCWRIKCNNVLFSTIVHGIILAQFCT